MADISQITLPSGGTYQIKDATARQQIIDLTGQLTGAVHFRGLTSSTITDGATVNPIMIDNKSYTAEAGDLVIYGNMEYIWSDVSNTWREFGSTGSLKALAFKDSANASYKPSGTVTKPTFTGTKASGLTVSPTSGTATYTPEGSINALSFTGNAAQASTDYTPEGSVTVKAGNSSTYKPAGTVSQPSFTGTAATVVVSGGSGTTTYTPAGSVSKPDVNVTPSTTTVNSITAVGTLPSLTTTVSEENLTISFSQGTLPTKGANTTVMTGASAALAATPTFTGTGTRLTASYTPAGSVSQPTFTGNDVSLTGTFSGTEATINSDYTPSGSITQPVFTGTGKRLVLQDYTPAGDVSQPTFQGTQATITVS